MGHAFYGHPAGAVERVLQHVLLSYQKNSDISVSELARGAGTDFRTAKKVLQLLVDLPQLSESTGMKMIKEKIPKEVFHLDPGPTVIVNCPSCGDPILTDLGFPKECQACHTPYLICECGIIYDATGYYGSFDCDCGRSWRVKTLIEQLLDLVITPFAKVAQVEQLGFKSSADDAEIYPVQSQIEVIGLRGSACAKNIELT